MSYISLIEKLVGQEAIIERLRKSRDVQKAFFEKPYVTISRDPGSGGHPIARLVAEKLKFKYYGHEILDEIARSAKLRKETIEAIDEKQRTAVQDWIHNLFNPDYVSEHTYIKHLCKVELSLAQRGHVVLLGRASNFITPRAFGLHVRITAPYRVCVARAVKYEGVSREKAREIIHKVMAERAGFVKQYFGKDVANPKYYDLVINTTFYTMEQAADLIVKAYRLKFGNG